MTQDTAGLNNETTTVEDGDTRDKPDSGSSPQRSLNEHLGKAKKRQATPEEPAWIQRLREIPMSRASHSVSARAVLSGQLQFLYLLNPGQSMLHDGIVIDLRYREPTRNGWGKFKRFKTDRDSFTDLADPEDRELCALITGGSPLDTGLGDFQTPVSITDRFRLPRGAQHALLKRLIDTGRCFVDKPGAEEPHPVTWGGDDPWVLWLVGTECTDGLEVRLLLRRRHWEVPANEVDVVIGGTEGIVVHDGQVAPLDDRDAFGWVSRFRQVTPQRKRASYNDSEVPRDRPLLTIATRDIPEFIDRMHAMAALPEVEFPDQLMRPEMHLDLVPHMELFSPRAQRVELLETDVEQEDNEEENDTKLPANRVRAAVWFAYGPYRVDSNMGGCFVPVEGGDVHVLRDRKREIQFLMPLVDHGFRPHPHEEGDSLTLPLPDMPDAVARLVQDGWVVRADHRIIRGGGTPSLSIRSGIDWFELHGGVQFETDHGTQVVGLPEILSAVKSGKKMITLDDGTQGVLPEDWLAEHGLLAAIGGVKDDHVRFQFGQAAILDALLDENDLVEIDDTFAIARDKLRNFDRVAPKDPSSEFNGTLRGYQREGLGWMDFLQWFGMGGILADDMGLGKTVQVLAMLDLYYSSIRKTPDGKEAEHRPSIIVVPRSLVFNWIDEARKFAGSLRVMAYAGSEREQMREAFAEHDLIISTYGLIRRDIEELSEINFHYAILDEAQAIKNPKSLTSKAVRLFNARHRLAVTGTPIENHLGDLWSIFEFLNPGLLGTFNKFSALFRQTIRDPKHPMNIQQAGRALRPFILRRTKKEVLQELPEKTEQTILCEMEPAQRKIYDDLTTYYRNTLLPEIHRRGMNKSSMIVLEALLRLRQAACHPGLIDSKYANEPSAKLDALMDQVAELIEEGHKALIFSQFTSLLGLVRTRLEAKGITYEYLDGQTRDRERRIKRFQSDPECPLFLISLKAGGQGLNLTAAGYVFLLDPWWNPAVEAQAIDRVHRIGQTQHVFVYRMICQGTVEQRITDLQAKKRSLADAIINDQGNMLSSLSRDDLEQLFT